MWILTKYLSENTAVITRGWELRKSVGSRTWDNSGIRERDKSLSLSDCKRGLSRIQCIVACNVAKLSTHMLVWRANYCPGSRAQELLVLKSVAWLLLPALPATAKPI